ncbi:MAG TPA: RNA 2',3'-cyclic phosphodiesterase [Persephonella sp.]|uniref:RNA 2',3'-cyclic phosphodiesterase n=1 Tax=Persephonella marina (strain DSM 14350 / EX-H1) TaxID=123214 RepID=C0QPI5_PERMH|nr:MULTISPECIES: RNA 2',3'-cyclic phosphodiesterase [Persephonella]ACO03778.1 2'-5' RNA ligase [Persephonella marina EX-H1]HCB69804.1 RNA 2',3'-cyclic phosphodiesterase [Persephonella sp.]
MFKKRIFIGSFIKLSNTKFYTRIKKDFGGITTGRWVPVQNFHITYRFIGDVTSKELEDIYSLLKNEINYPRTVSLNLKGVGAFPNISNPRVFFIKVEDSNGDLVEINNFIQDRLSVLGYKKEIKPFVPHITLKRLKGVKREDFVEKVKKYEDILFDTQESLEVNIIESILTPQGAVYKKILL